MIKKSKTISDLIEKISASDSDVLLIEDNEATNKITKENFLKEINDGIDNLSDRVQKIETLQKENETEVSTDKGYVVCENTNNGQIEELKIEGKTLVNLVQEDFSNSVTITGIKGYNKDLIKPNAIYTVFINVVSNNLSDDSRFIIEFHGQNSTSKLYVNSGETGVFTKVLKTHDTCSHTLWVTNGGSVSVKNYIILEGDHTQNPPSYFKGLKSVGDGVDKIEVLSRKEDGNLFDGQLEIGSINNTTGLDEATLTLTCVRSKNYIPIKNNSVITLSNDMGYANYIYEYDKNYNFIKMTSKTTSNTLTTSNITKYIRFRSVSSKSENNLSVLYQLTYGDVSPNKPYKGNKKQILFKNSTGTYEKTVLRSTGTVSDTIEKHSDGKYYFHKRCGEVIFDGSSDENWLLNTSSETTQSFRYPYSVDMAGDLICDKFVQDDSSHNGVEGILISKINTPNEFSIEILKTKLSSVDVTGFKKWLQSNPVTVVYALATEEIYECTNLDLNAYEGETSVICNSNIPPTSMSFKIANHISNVVNIINNRVNAVENQVSDVLKSQGKVLNMFRAVLAGDMQTLAYELYPEDFEEEITADEGLERPSTLEEPTLET